jgi:hypothetical protein
VGSGRGRLRGHRDRGARHGADAAGEARTTWVLGTIKGSESLIVGVGTLAARTITIAAAAGRPAQVNATNGAYQNASAFSVEGIQVQASPTPWSGDIVATSPGLFPTTLPLIVRFP